MGLLWEMCCALVKSLDFLNTANFYTVKNIRRVVKSVSSAAKAPQYVKWKPQEIWIVIQWDRRSSA
jgi:hypothetical protein